MSVTTLLIILGSIIVLAILGWLFTPKSAYTREELDAKKEKEEYKAQLKDGEIISPGKWFLIYLLTSIPVVGFVAICVLSFKEGNNPTLKSWARLLFIIQILSIIAFVGIFVFMYLGLNNLI